MATSKDLKTCFYSATASFIPNMSENLCSRDLSILNLIFDRSFVEKEVKDYKQPVIDESDSKDIDEGNSETILSSRKLELEGVELAEAGKLEEALEKLNRSVDKSDQRPSPYNNRAQLYRFIEKDDCKEISVRPNAILIFCFIFVSKWLYLIYQNQSSYVAIPST